MNAESESISKVSKVLRRTDYLEPYITENDKTPVWDGFVLVYNNKNFPHRKDTLRGRVSVQIKGHEVKELPREQVKYSVDVRDLKAFQKDGGAIFFNVYINPAYITRIYYKIFLPLDLGRILQKTSDQKTVTLDFIPFPTDKSVIISIFMNFLTNQKKQISTVNNKKLFLKDWNNSEIEPSIANITMPVTVFKDPDREPFELITSMPQYLYVTPKNFEHISIPVEIMENIAIGKDVFGPIEVGNKTYYHEYKVIWFEGNPTIHFGKGLEVSLNRVVGEKQTNSYKISTTLTGKGTLQERIKDIEFFLGFYENKGFSINSIEFPLLDKEAIDRKQLNQFQSALERLRELQNKLGELQVEEYLDMDELLRKDPNEEWKLNELLIIGKGKEHKLKENNTELIPIQILTIANIKILLFVTLREEKEIYLDYYSPQFQLIAKEAEDSTEEIYMSQYTILKEHDLIVSNFKGKAVFEDIIRYEPTEYYLQQLNLFLLEVIKAYDSRQGKTEELYTLAYKLSKWITEQKNGILDYLNYLQVTKRKNKLPIQEIERLQKELENYSEDLYIYLGINILLNEKEKVQKSLNSLSKDKQSVFKNYPIYYLLDEEHT